MSTRYAWITAPTWDQVKAQSDYDHIKEKLFDNKDTTEIQLVNFGKLHCVTFITRELSPYDPYKAFYLLETPTLSYITDEGTGGYLE